MGHFITNIYGRMMRYDDRFKISLRLEGFDCFLNLSKCLFAMPSIGYIGFEIVQEGI
jgi:hypothetical protein